MNDLEGKSPSVLKLVIIAGVSFCIVLALVIVVLNVLISTRSTPVPSNMDCLNNLHQIDAAAQEFALEYRKTNGEAINFPDDLTPYIKLGKDGKLPSCPQGGVYSIKKVGDVPTCSLGTTVTPAHVLP
jgi:hypothetical protein